MQLRLFLFAASLLLLSGCGSKQYVTPSVPTPKHTTKVLDDSVLTIKQGLISQENIESSLNEAPNHVLGTTLHIENKTNQSVMLEIERTNVAVYDTEDLALMFSKVGLKDPLMKELTLSHDIAQGFTIGIAGGLTAFTAYELFQTLKNSTRNTATNIFGMQISTTWLLGIATVLIPMIGSYVYKAISADKTNIIESEEERLIDQFRLLFSSNALSFDDCVEIAPHSILKQTIFYDGRSIESDMTNQRALVLRYATGDQKVLVPLEI